MDLNELPRFAAMQQKKFKKADAGVYTDRERVFLQLAKLGEEYGELCEQILGAANAQHVHKAGKCSPEKLASEFADVALVLAILADVMGVDLGDAIEKKIVVINERFKDVAL
jgi:NTP pyrophosphatase (non-canonical NTP hydrolase)